MNDATLAATMRPDVPLCSWSCIAFPVRCRFCCSREPSLRDQSTQLAESVLGRRMKNEWNHPQILRGSFSAVSTATIATNYSFLQHFSRSTRFSYFCTAQISKFQRNPVQILPEWKWKFIFHSRFSMNSAIFWRKFGEILPEFYTEMFRKWQTVSRFCEEVRQKFWKF